MRKALLTTVLLLASAMPAYAYLDPGTGSMVLQAIVGTVAVAGAMVSLYWQKLRSFFQSIARRKKIS